MTRGIPPGALALLAILALAALAGAASAAAFAPGDYVTYSKGAYAGNGAPARLLAANWQSQDPFYGLEVGIVDGYTGYSWEPTAEGLANLRAFLRNGGRPGPITADAFSPNEPTYGGGTLATQAAALGLKLQLDERGLLGSAGDLGSLVFEPGEPIEPIDPYYPFVGMTVAQIRDAANVVLAGYQPNDPVFPNDPIMPVDPIVPTDPYYGALTSLAGNLNTAFDRGTVSAWARENLQSQDPT